MTNSATSLIVLFLALSVFAQDSAPDWIEESWRSARYPRSEWYIGFATDKIREQPSSKEYQAIEASAKNMLSESIIVNVQSASTFQATSRQTQDTEIINKSFDQNIQIKSNAVLAKVDVKSYFDKKSDVAVDRGSTFVKRPAPGSNTSGIIYGNVGNDANSTGAQGGRGHAIASDRPGYSKQRNTTLGYYDEISTNSNEGWE